MDRFEVRHRYAAYRDGEQYGPWQPGDTVELSAEAAEWILRDSPGAISQVVVNANKPAERAAKPAANRQHKGGRNRAGA